MSSRWRATGPSAARSSTANTRRVRDEVIGQLFAHLKNRYPEARGYSPRNLEYRRAFEAAWPDSEVVQGDLAQLPWYHHIALLEKLDPAELGQWYAARRWRAAGPPLSPTSWPDELTSSLPSIDEIEAELATTLQDGAY